MRIFVTAEDIALGERKDCRSCPVALAVRRATGRRCEVDNDEIGFPDAETDDDDPLFDLPPVVGMFVADFDEGEAVEPFAFDLPDAFVRGTP